MNPRSGKRWPSDYRCYACGKILGRARCVNNFIITSSLFIIIFYYCKMIWGSFIHFNPFFYFTRDCTSALGHLEDGVWKKGF